MIRLIALVVIVGRVASQPPGGGGGGGLTTTSGSVSSSACLPTSTTACTADGSASYSSRSLSYSSTTGIFTGTMVTNQCNAYPRKVNGVQISLGVPTLQCQQQTFPAPAYTGTPPMASPLLGRIGLNFRTGVNVYNAIEAGFTAGQACTVNAGVCPAGMDLHVCETLLLYQCGGKANVNWEKLMDDCGSHASPYHSHMNPACEYANSTSGHSTLVSIMLDGRGTYGLYEAAGGVVPSDLDACGGHYGPVPATTYDGVTYAAASNVYHYHWTAFPPYSIGCYGPATSNAAAKALYTGCGASGTKYSGCSTRGNVTNYPLFCPIYENTTGMLADYFVPSAACPDTNAVASATPSQAASPSLSASQAASQSLSASQAATATQTLSVGASPSQAGTASPSQAASASSSQAVTGSISPTASATRVLGDTSSSSSSSSSGPSAGVIAGATVGAVVGAVLLVALIALVVIRAGGKKTAVVEKAPSAPPSAGDPQPPSYASSV